jgi:putative ABC transport system ATP-binding protein
VSAAIASLRNVSKRYDARGGAVVALDGATLEVEPGGYVAIMGPSGSGKSTLLNILGGVDRPTEGQVYIDDVRIDTMGERALLGIRRSKVGFVFQEARLLPSLTAIENVLLPTAFWRSTECDEEERAHFLLEKVGLAHRANHLVHQLSGGEAQRVCIARALAVKPKIILADEPTGNLDQRTRMDVIKVLEQLHEEEGTAIVLVTHDPEVATRARKRYIMRNGQLAETVDEH